jgi:hypothetical protein
MSGILLISRVTRSSRISRSTVLLLDTPGMNAAATTRKSKRFQPLRKNRVGRKPSAANRSTSSTTNTPRNTRSAHSSRVCSHPGMA